MIEQETNFGKIVNNKTTIKQQLAAVGNRITQLLRAQSVKNS